MNKSKLPNVLVIATTFPRYKNDAEPAFVFNLSKGLATKGFNIVVLVPGAPDALPYEEMCGLKVYRFPYFYPKKFQTVCYGGGALPNLKNSWLAKIALPFLLISQFIHIGKIIKKEKIDLIHCHWVVPQGFSSAIYKNIFKIPLILTAHAGDVFFALNRFFLLPFAKFAISQSEMCVANSKATQKAIREISDKKTNAKIIPMGVDLDTFGAGRKESNIRAKYNINGPMLLAVGRFAEKKGFKYLIDAIPLILNKRPKTKLFIIGFGPLEKSLKDQASRLKIGDAVIFPGAKSSIELSEYYSESDIYVGPSIIDESGDTEGLGIVFLEALASNTPVVASRVGGIVDFIIDRETGMLVNQKDPEDIAKKIIELIEDKKLCEKIASQGKKFVNDNFSWDAITERYDSIYKQILKNKQADWHIL